MLAIINPTGFVLSGLVAGSVYGLAAMGVVFTYKVARVVNFAYGVVAMFSAYCYWQFRVRWHWPVPLGLFVAVLVIPTALALLSERVVYRRLSGSSVFARIAASAGILLAVYGISQYIWNNSIVAGILEPRSVFSTNTAFMLGKVHVSYEQLGVILSVAVIAAAMFTFLRYTRWGVQLRAVVVNRSLAELRGINSLRISQLSWVISYILAAVSGILIAPLIGGGPATLTLIVVYSLAAAVLGGLVSLPLAFAGGVGLGLIDSLILAYVPSGSLTSWVSGVFPFAFLFLALVIQARSLSAAHAGESKTAMLADLAGAATIRRPAVKSTAFWVVLVFIAGLIVWGTGPLYVNTVSNGVALAILYLSYRIFTAATGMVSFAQVGFAGIGAFTAANLVTVEHWPWILAVLAGGLLTTLIGAIVALPTVRLRGVFLALATLAFALFVNEGIYASDSFTGSVSGKMLSRPDFARSDFTYLVLLLVAFAVLGYLCERFQYSVIGRELKADLGSTQGALSIGISPQRGRLLAFMLAAGVAGIGGSLLGGIVGNINVNEWSLVPTAFVWLATVAIAGIGSTGLMLELGVLSAVLAQVVAKDFPSIENAYVAIFGVLALIALRIPGGTFAMQEAQKRALAKIVKGARRGPEKTAGVGATLN